METRWPRQSHGLKRLLPCWWLLRWLDDYWWDDWGRPLLIEWQVTIRPQNRPNSISPGIFPATSGSIGHWKKKLCGLVSSGTDGVFPASSAGWLLGRIQSHDTWGLFHLSHELWVHVMGYVGALPFEPWVMSPCHGIRGGSFIWAMIICMWCVVSTCLYTCLSVQYMLYVPYLNTLYMI